MNKKQIRLTESDLKQIVKESINKILKESYNDDMERNTLSTRCLTAFQEVVDRIGLDRAFLTLGNKMGWDKMHETMHFAFPNDLYRHLY